MTQARSEAAFLRGDAGVDGVATDADGRDAAEVERDQAREQLLRGRTWLGRELLTWLLWRSEAGDPLARGGRRRADGPLHRPHHPARPLRRRDRARRPRHRRALLGEVRRALDARAARAPGPAPPRARRAGLRGDAGRRVPRRPRREASAAARRGRRRPRRSSGSTRPSSSPSLVDALAGAFLEARSSRSWAQRTVPALKRWMRGEDEAEATPAKSGRSASSSARARSPRA